MASPTSAKPVRGCFQCSRRRIICDRNEPTCFKCDKKGLECSGLSRIRFAKGVARRGRWRDCKVPSPKGDDTKEDAELPTEVRFRALKWPGEGAGRNMKRKRGDKVEDGVRIIQFASVLDESAELSSDGEAVQISPVVAEEGEIDNDAVEEIGRGDGFVSASHSPVLPWIAPIDPEARMLFSYFSQAVAPAMVVLDNRSNGYRSLVLPMALEDDLLRRAVSVVALQHLSRERPELELAADAGRAAVISRLHRDSLKQSADKVFNKFTWATLIVLLVGETVTGSVEFRFFMHMLRCLSSNGLSSHEDPALMAFLLDQSHMFELLGLPQLGENRSVLTVMKAPESLMGFLSYSHLPRGSEERRIAKLIRQCFVSACDIYAQCAASTSTSTSTSIDTDSSTSTSTSTPTSIDTPHTALQDQSLHHLINTMARIPAHAPGAHALVWVCFVAGAAATQPAHRAFFVHRMNAAYECTRFRNIPAAVRGLERIWLRAEREKWTGCLPLGADVLVM